MNSDTQTSIHPWRRNGFCGRFRAVLVFGVELVVTNVRRINFQLFQLGSGICRDSLGLGHSSVGHSRSLIGKLSILSDLRRFSKWSLKQGQPGMDRLDSVTQGRRWHLALKGRYDSSAPGRED